MRKPKTSALDRRFGSGAGFEGIKADRIGIFGESEDERSKAEVFGFRTP